MNIKIYETLKNIFRKCRNNKENSIDYQNAKMILKNDKNCILLDVRSPQEYKEGHLDGSINIPLYDIEKDVSKIIPKKENTVIVYCQSGGRSKKALEILKKEGYTNLYNIEGGLDGI